MSGAPGDPLTRAGHARATSSPAHFQPPGGVWTDENWPAHEAASKAAAGKCRAGYTRLYTRRGRRAHLAPDYARVSVACASVLCHVLPAWPDDWRGTGSQAEYELAAELETCSRCRAAFMASCRCGNPECPCNSLPDGAP